MDRADDRMRAADLVARDRVDLRVPSRVEWVDEVAVFLVSRAEAIGICDSRRAAKLRMALSEALTNAIVHGNLEISSELKEQGNAAFAEALSQRGADPRYGERMVTVSARYDGKYGVWSITDEGPGFDHATVLSGLDATEPDLESASGRGLLMMRALVDDVGWFEGGRRVDLVLEAVAPDRREEPRKDVLSSVRVAPIRPDGAVDWTRQREAVALNISHGGIGLLQGQLGDVNRLVIEIPDGSPIYLAAEVCHKQSVDDRTTQVGCRFLPPDPGLANQLVDPTHAASLAAIDQVVESLVDRSVDAGEIQEERTAMRVPYTKLVWVAPDERAGAQRVTARDLSKGGLSVVAGFEIPIGRIVHVYLPRDGGDDLELYAQVRRCQRIAGEYFDLGLMFVMK